MSSERQSSGDAAFDLVRWDPAGGALFRDLTMLDESEPNSRQRLAKLAARELYIARHIRNAHLKVPELAPMTLREAIEERGTSIVRGYALARTFVLCCNGEDAPPEEHPFWLRTMAVALLASVLALKRGEHGQWAFSAGLVAGIGRLQLLRSGADLDDAGIRAHEIGREFARASNLPRPVSEVFELPANDGIAELVDEAGRRATYFGYDGVAAMIPEESSSHAGEPTGGLKSASYLHAGVPSLLACAGIWLQTT